MEFFADSMCRALYGENGYYQHAKIGKEGDFYTSVSAGELFGDTIAALIAQSFEQCGFPRTIVEIGADRGYLLADIMRYLQRFFPRVFESLAFVIIEPLSTLAQKQRAYFDTLGLHVRIVESAETFDSPLFVANELFDAMPCDLLRHELGAYTFGMFENQKFAFVPLSALSGEQADYARRLVEVAQRFCVVCGEIPLAYLPFLEQLLTQQEHWAFLTFDYGERGFSNAFSLRFFKESAIFGFEDFMRNPHAFLGNADITYDVAWEYVQWLFERFGGACVLYGRQNSILLRMGLVEVFERIVAGLSPEKREYIHYASTLKTLISPTLLGERFKGALYVANTLQSEFAAFLKTP